MRRALLKSVVVVVVVLGFAPPAHAQREVQLPITQGKLSVLALTRTLLSEYGYAGEHLTFPDILVDIQGVKGSLLLKGLSTALGGTARLKKVDGGKSVVIVIDQGRARVMRHVVKDRFGRFVSLMVGQDIMARQYVLDVPEGLSADATFVLCVHGLDSSGRAFHDLRRELGRGNDGIRSGTFTYANDEAIDRIAEDLSARLKKRAIQFPEQKIIVVAHSMGGLVSRYMLETKALDPGNVTTLVMLGVPNHGSRLARLRSGMDLLEFFRDQGDKPRVLGPWLDGMGEAGWDLWPESPFLVALNKKPRNPGVAYHSILGDKSLMTEKQLAVWRALILTKVGRMKQSEVYEKKVASWLTDLDELLHGAGDGAVSLERGRLVGVKEVVVHRAHNDLLRASPKGETQEVFEQVRAWVVAARRAK